MKKIPDNICDLLSYDAETGRFKAKVKLGIRTPADSFIGSVDGRGYVQISINRKVYKAHRLAYYMQTGIDPGSYQVDHINGDRTDNRIVNLRLATNSQNQCNAKLKKSNKSGCKGVYWFARKSKWCAMIKASGKTHFLGYFSDKESASEAYTKAAEKFHGPFVRRLQ